MMIVLYQDEDYHAAWVGARTVCRLGTSDRRVFKSDGKSFDEAELVTIRAGVYTVKHIFVEGTRKRGKQRMTTLSAEQLITLIREHADDEMTPELVQMLHDALAETDGVRITLASAKRLGMGG